MQDQADTFESRPCHPYRNSQDDGPEHSLVLADSIELRWHNGSLEDERVNPGFQHKPREHCRRSSDEHLEIIGQFEFCPAYYAEHQTQTWDNANLMYDPKTSDTTAEHAKKSHDNIDPWNHIQAFDSLETLENQVYWMNSDIGSAQSGGILISETLARPGSSPPDSGTPFISSNSNNGLSYVGSTNRYDWENIEATRQFQGSHGLNVLPPGFSSLTPIRTGSEATQSVIAYQVENPTDYFSLDTYIDGRSLSQPDETLVCYDDAELLSYHDEGSWVFANDTSSYHGDEMISFYRHENSQENIEITSPRPAAMPVEGTSEGSLSESGLTLSPEVTNFPDFEPASEMDPAHYLGISPPRPSDPRRASQNAKRNRKTSTTAMKDLLPVIHEDGKGGLAPPALHILKGRRAGPLSRCKAAQAAKNRKEKRVCIRCKVMKQSCSGETPCRGCRENVGAKVWKSPCVRAEFLDIIEAGTCNYISQRSINHLTLDESRRVKRILPESFHLTQLLDLLKPRLSRFNIHARQLSGPLYTLDLAKCYNFLTEIHKVQKSGTLELRDFIDNNFLLKASGWLKCVTKTCTENESLALLAKWNNMPSRASYDIVSLVEGEFSRPMDIENPEDGEEILLAAQLSRIVCRALEVTAFRFLQKELNKLAKASNSNEGTEKFVRELGQILLTLRWRIAWWEILGDGSTTKDEARDRYIYRVQSLTRVLYFYFCNAKKKLPSWTDLHSLKGVQSCYADAEPIFDEYPHDDSIEGFQEWMKHGQELISQARVQQQLSRY